MIKILENHGYTGSKVKLTTMLHLKTGVNYLENNTILATGEFLDFELHPYFKDFNVIEISDEDALSVNSVWINGTVITPKGYPKTK